MHRDHAEDQGRVGRARAHGRIRHHDRYLDPVVPRDTFVGQTPNGDGLKYAAKYAAVGAIAFTDVKLLDGLNEAGLAVGAFYFPTFAEYTPVTLNNQKKGLSPRISPTGS